MIDFSCKWCGKRYHAPPRYAGHSYGCRRCGKPVFVPAGARKSEPVLQFGCEGCGKRYRTPVRYAGLRQVCRGCGAMVTAPGVPPPVLEASKQAAPEPDPTLEMQRIADVELFLDLPPFELIPAADDLPDAELINEPELELPPTGAAPRGRTVRLDPPLEPKAPPPEPEPMASTPPVEKAKSAPSGSPPMEPEPPPLKKRCPHCGQEETCLLHSRSPLGTLAMLGGAAAGLGALLQIEQDWRFVLVAAASFSTSIAGAFQRRRTIICAGCERQLR